jgi:putative ABC transport system substrate-binding protein
MASHIERRKFLATLGGAAAWPLAARAQQPAIPLIGFLSALSEKETSHQMVMFRRGLNEVGFVEGQNVALDYRWADGQYNQLPAMAAELVRRPVTLIVAQGPPAALAARAMTTSIPRPGGNATGMTLMTGPLGQKRLELLRESRAQGSRHCHARQSNQSRCRPRNKRRAGDSAGDGTPAQDVH